MGMLRNFENMLDINLKKYLLQYLNFALRFARFIKRCAFLNKVEKDAFVVDLPDLPKNSGTFSAEELYLFWWPAENVQYYRMNVIPYKISFRKNKNKYLIGDYLFAYFPLKYSFDCYFENVIKSPERALIRKAMRSGIKCRRIDYDNYLEEIRIINRSKEYRGGRPMTEEYLNPECRESIVKLYNQGLYTFGAFSSDGHLIAYYMFEKVTNFYHTVKGICHNDYLKYGVMNYLFAYSVSELKQVGEQGEAIIYGCITHDSSDGLSRFKLNVGCVEKRIILNGTESQFEALDFFVNTYHLHGDTGMNYILDYIKS